MNAPTASMATPWRAPTAQPQRGEGPGPHRSELSDLIASSPREYRSELEAISYDYDTSDGDWERRRVVDPLRELAARGHTSWHMRASWVANDIEQGADDEENEEGWGDGGGDEDERESSLSDALLSHAPGRPPYHVQRDRATGSRYFNAHLHERALYDGQLLRSQVRALRAQLRNTRKARRTPVKPTGTAAWRRRASAQGAR